MDASGAETPNFHDLNCAYQQISLSNVPFDKDLCFPANPLNEYLEMFADVSDARRPSKQNILVREPTQHVKKVSIRASSVRRRSRLETYNTVSVMSSGRVTKVSRFTLRVRIITKVSRFTCEDNHKGLSIYV